VHSHLRCNSRVVNGEIMKHLQRGKYCKVGLKNKFIHFDFQKVLLPTPEYVANRKGCKNDDRNNSNR
jgi:hypothetical protein